MLPWILRCVSIFAFFVPCLGADALRAAPQHRPAWPGPGDTVSITLRLAPGPGQRPDLWIDDGTGLHARPMFDDGLHGDADAGDGVYGALVAPRPAATRVRYQVAVDGRDGGRAERPGDAEAWPSYRVGATLPAVVINEILASNQNGIVDEFGEAEDWLELRNAGPDTIDVGGMYLTDDLSDGLMWALPSVLIEPGGYLRIWCDDDGIQGPLHANFRLGRGGGEVGLFSGTAQGNVPIDTMVFGLQAPDLSFGFVPEDGDAPEYLILPTPGLTNEFSPTFSAIVINEFLTTSAVGVPDWIELTNRGNGGINLAGLGLSDDPGTPMKFVFPAGTLLAPGAFIAMTQDELGFGLSAGGERLQLTAPDGETGLDFVEFGPQVADVSLGRYPDGGASWHLMSGWTFGASNRCGPGATIGPVAGLRFEDAVTLAWLDVPGAESFDLLRGDLGTLQASGGAFSAAIDGCVINNTEVTRAWVPDAPGPGAGRFYLVRGVNFACGFGTYDGPPPGPDSPRDGAIDASSAACP